MDCLIDRLNSSRCPRKTLPSLAEAPFSPDTHRLSVAFFTSLTPETLCEVVKYRLLVEMAAALPGAHSFGRVSIPEKPGRMRERAARLKRASAHLVELVCAQNRPRKGAGTAI